MVAPQLGTKANKKAQLGTQGAREKKRRHGGMKGESKRGGERGRDFERD